MQDQELLRAFFLESGEILNRADESLRSLRDAPTDAELVNALFRGVHTIKGNSSFLDLESVTRVSHAAETLLDRARQGALPNPGPLADHVARALEDLRAIIERQEMGHDVTPTVRAIERFLAGDVGAGSPPAPVPVAPVAAPPAAPKVALGSFTRVDDQKIAKILAVASELELLRYALERVPERMEAFGPALADLRFEVDLQISKLSRLSRSLSSLVFGVRLVPVNQVFRRFPRVIEELGRKLGKEIGLEVKNGDAELDKAVVEAIADPMTHLIRNAADHGIEGADERRAAGKPARGTVRLDSYVRGNFVYIEIADDGRGIDGDRILRKAVEKGLVPAAKAPTFTESQKLALIFAPGFSTAEQVTDISGRGVGMDVVKNHIEQLKGTVILDSKLGQGTRILLRFPMSLAVLFSLFVSVGRESNQTSCAIPVDQIDESMDYEATELLPEIPAGDDADAYLALFSVRTLLWGDDEGSFGRRAFHALRFREHGGRAFVVEDFSSIEEAVVQSVDSYIGALPGIQGASIRKDGSVALVINPEALNELAAQSAPLGYVLKKDRVQQDDGLADFLALTLG